MNQPSQEFIKSAAAIRNELFANLNVQPESNGRGRLMGIAALAVVGVSVAGMASSDSDSSITYAAAPAAVEAPAVQSQEVVESPAANLEVANSAAETTATVAPATTEAPDSAVVTDESLQARSITCGGKYDNGVSMLDLSYKFDYFAENVEMGKSIMDTTVTNSEFGMGQSAFNYAMNNSFYNPATVENLDDRTTGIEQTDEFINNIHTAVLNESHTFTNGDCRNDATNVSMPSPDKPFITLNKGETVEGIIIPADKLERFLKLMKNQEKFLFLEGSIVGADGKEVKTIFVTLFANGCDNPIRIEVTPPVEVPPTIPETTVPPTIPETTVPPTTTPPTTAPPTTTPPTTTPPTTTKPPTTTTTTTTVPHTTTTTTTTPPTTTTTVPGRKVPTTTIAPAPTTNPADRPTTTLWRPPTTAAPDTLPPGVTPTTWDSVPTPSTIQDPEQPPVTAIPPTTAAPSATLPPRTPPTGTVVTR